MRRPVKVKEERRAHPGGVGDELEFVAGQDVRVAVHFPHGLLGHRQHAPVRLHVQVEQSADEQARPVVRRGGDV